jgi:tRNA G46 methylase TrmB
MRIQVLSFLRSIKKKLHYYFIQSKRETAPEAAYDIWASTYDEQSDNPLIYLDEAVFGNLLDRANLAGKIIVDIGCGTGKHWGKYCQENH